MVELIQSFTLTQFGTMFLLIMLSLAIGIFIGSHE